MHDAHVQAMAEVRKWSTDRVPSVVVPPTGVAYSFLMECPVPSTRRETEKKKESEEIRVMLTVGNCNSGPSIKLNFIPGTIGIFTEGKLPKPYLLIIASI